MKFKTANMTKWALCFGFATLANFSQAQEAFKEILTFSFEGAEEITELQGISALNGVSSPTAIKADLFSKKSQGDVAIPNNVYGYEDPTDPISGEKKTDKDNNVYAGIVAYKPGKMAAERSYITIPFDKSQKLVKGMTYCIEFSVSLAESSKFACNNLGVYFSSSEPSGDDPLYVSGDHVVKSSTNSIYNGFFGWDKVCNIYTAKGDEKYLTIGNFDKNESTKFQPMKKPKDSEVEALAHAYYYVDNIIIRMIELDPKTKEPKNKESCACYYNRPPKIEESFSTLVYDKTPEINDKMSLDKKIAAQTIYFRAGKTSLTENAVANLNFIVAQLNANPNLNIEVIGHNDPLENKAGEEDEKFKGMDLQRIEAVKRYIVSQGIDEKRLSPVQMSDKVQSTEVAEDDDQETKDAKNRRVEFRVKL
jgi:outer membrane protein OmpA-like peptidoglycan-associated protein